jgi:hypothetical protein
MNNPKLTNALLIALIAINVLFLAGWGASAMHRRHEHRFAMYNKFRGRGHDSFTFHHRFGAYRGYHKGKYCGGFRNFNNSRWN